jgi:homoserine kinase
MNEVKLRVPATIANLVCGFDILGMAIAEPFDEVTVRHTAIPGIQIVHTDRFNLPTSAEQNVAGVALKALMNKLGDNRVGFEVIIHKNIKPGSGLGSSAASSAAAVFGANELLNRKFSLSELVEFAMEGERVASGAAHADNIAPCLYGGITLIRSTQPLDIVPLPAPELFITVLHPQIELRTSESRSVLPSAVPLKDAVLQWGNIAGLVSGIYRNDTELISRSLVDIIAEPARKHFIPFYEEIKSAALSAGALGGGISGSGPSVFMISQRRSVAEQVDQAIRNIYLHTDLQFNTYVTGIEPAGIQII